MKKMYLLLSVLLCALPLFAQPSPVEKDAVYLDSSQPVEARIQDLLARMTLEEKVAQMCQYVGLAHMKRAEKELSASEVHNNDAFGYYKSLHSSDVAKMTEQGLIGSFLHVVTAEEGNYLQELAQKSRLKIPVLIGIDAIHGNGLYAGATVYPSPISLASTWNPELVEEIGRQTAVEMRATGSHWAFTPNIDVARDPRWGRVGETFGEDPLLVTKMGVAMVEGMQQGDFTGPEKVITCIKHLIAGSEPINGLNAAPMDISMRTLREVYLPPYKEAVRAGAFSAMTAHNELNGVPCHTSKMLMTEILRNEFGFKGFIVSDWMDIERVADLHRTAENQKEACYQTIDAGMDMHMHGPGFLKPVIELVNEGRLTEARIDASVGKILEAKFKLGLFENPIVDIEKSKSILSNDAHKETALKAAREGIVLLKNDNLLPLDGSRFKKIFVTGPNANNETILGDWAADQPDGNVITVLEGIKEQAPEGTDVSFFDSGEVIRRIEDSKIKEAAALAKDADVAIVVVGENSMRYRWKDKTNGENMGRADLKLAGKQLELVKSIHASGTPVLVILATGRPLAVTWIAENIPALIQAWEPGNMGGKAIAEIIFGKTNPGGKLPITIARSVGQLQMIYNHKPSHYFHKYAFEKESPLYPFGFGLSYTTFTYSNLRLGKATIGKDQSVTVKVELENTGSRAGDEVVQLYIRDDVSSVTRPVMELKHFKRLNLAAGERQTVEFVITPEDLSFYNLEMEWGVEPGEFKIMVGGSSQKSDLSVVKLTVK